MSRQLRKCIFAALCLVPIAGCSISPGLLDDGADDIITGSISTSPKPNNVEISDWLEMRTALNEAANQKAAGSLIPWENDRTGSSGSLMAFAAPSDEIGRCRNFAATLQNIDGIHRYKGEACIAGQKNWQINRFELVDRS
ncbi:RT0821/Lpp0805 family surface protein [Pararhizobium sp. IMCC21322]|uniref:RT0821/Lpp0805 family surface protein n=1 Tax=Pararhizobium sp. IMCC21322 TaxID=3067903 RepID=UPI002742935C|nr:RT0821/Lpp0805 family surface protein [Pararhizobium sp. IMCC21322]